MDTESHDGFAWDRITFSRAKVLREIADSRTEREVAVGLQVAYTTVRSHIAELKGLTGCHDVREMGRWWRDNREDWLDWCKRQAGCSLEREAGP
ncbi:MAG: hypothetical protein KJ053_10845 [Dehalococcoidia bacterium]|nr:hypothetical protein [Dehalococcoidia bacterium]